MARDDRTSGSVGVKSPLHSKPRNERYRPVYNNNVTGVTHLFADCYSRLYENIL
jgi:hypothetical protein